MCTGNLGEEEAQRDADDDLETPGLSQMQSHGLKDRKGVENIIKTTADMYNVGGEAIERRRRITRMGNFEVACVFS